MKRIVVEVMLYQPPLLEMADRFIPPGCGRQPSAQLENNIAVCRVTLPPLFAVNLFERLRNELAHQHFFVDGKEAIERRLNDHALDLLAAQDALAV